MSLETDISCLRRLALFGTLPPPRLKLVALMGQKLAFAAGERIIHAGDEPAGVHVVLEGEVEITQEHPEGGGRRITLASGSLLGDVPILCGRRYLGEVTATSAVSALWLPKDLFFELLETIPDFSLALSRDLASRLYRLADAALHEEKLH
jgi:CRP-like cAMP-binding protein